MKILQKIMNKKINFIYEFKTPNGYLPIGFDYRQLGMIFDTINKIEYEGNNCINSYRFGYDDTFKMLQTSTSAYDFLNLKDLVENKTIYELNEDDINNSINIFVIDSMHNEPIVNYVDYTDFNNILSKKSKEFLKNNTNFRILIIDNKEGAYAHEIKFFNNLKRLHSNLELRTNYQLYYITNSSDISQKYQTFLKKTKTQDFMKVKNIEFLIYDAGEPIVSYFNLTNNLSENVVYEQDVEYSLPIEDEINVKRNKYFLNLNRNSGRLHRPKLVLELIKNNLFDKGIISLLQSDEFDKFANQNDNIEYKQLIYDKYPFVIDFENPDFVSGMHNFFTKKDMWMQSYFSVVSETSANDNWCFITEKTVRPIIYYHPFIVWGNPGTLKVLKSYGFETFPEFFDESYDDIYDSNLRLSIIMQNLNRLCNMDLEDIHKLYEKVIPKLIYNRNLLTSLYINDIRNSEILKFIKKEHGNKFVI
jgi:hypothetical protein